MLEKKYLKDINSKKEILDKQIDEEIKKAEEEIEILKKVLQKKLIKLQLKHLQNYEKINWSRSK